MSKVRAIFLGTPDIARQCLETMLNDEHYELVGVVSQPDRPAGRKLQLQASPVKTLAQERGLPILTPENVNAPDVLEAVAEWRAEVAVVVAFGQIVSQKFLNLFPGKVVNVHASLLPRWRGAAPIQRALMAGDKESGVCLQVMVKKLDAGPVLGARKIPLSENTDAAELFGQMGKLGADLLVVELMDYLRGNLTPVPQNPDLVTYAAKLEKSEAEIDWAKSSEAIHNLVRGLVMGPVAQTHRGGALLKIVKTQLVKNAAHTLRPGQVVEVSDKHLRLSCGQGTLELLEVQPESRARMTIQDYLRGYPVKAGEVFGGAIPRST